MKNTNRTSRLNGFTIIELVVVITIIGILAAIVLVSYNGIQVRAVDASVSSDLERMDALQTSYGLKNSTAGLAYYSGSGAGDVLGFSPSGNNVIDVVTNSTDYCIRAYNLKGTKNSLNNSQIKESTANTCNTLCPSAAAIIATTGGSGICVTGGTVTHSGSNTIRTFTTSGTFTITGGTISGASVLVVGGGGGGGSGGSYSSGGGGGGGQFILSTQNLSGSITVTVGSGGSGGSGGTSGLNGGISVFGPLSAIAGGGGGGYQIVGKSGASGGGGGMDAVGGPGTAGHNGGDANGYDDYSSGGGGGGAGAGGGIGGSGNGGIGGIGLVSNISGLSTYYAGGGSGSGYFGSSDGGLGGGGRGSEDNLNLSGTNGSNNTGGGGGGGSIGGNGGSGIVIISYPTSSAY